MDFYILGISYLVLNCWFHFCLCLTNVIWEELTLQKFIQRQVLKKDLLKDTKMCWFCKKKIIILCRINTSISNNLSIIFEICEFWSPIQYLFPSIIKVDVIVNSANPNLDLTQGRASSSLLAAAGSRIQRECQQNYPRGLRAGEIAVTSGGNLRCTAIYHGALTRYSSHRDEQVSVFCTIRYIYVLLGGYLNSYSPYIALQRRVVGVVLFRRHSRRVNVWLTSDKIFPCHAYNTRLNILTTLASHLEFDKVWQYC